MITLFREIPNEEELYAIFHPPFDVVKKSRLEPPIIGLFSGARSDSVDVKLIPDLYKSPFIYVFPVVSIYVLLELLCLKHKLVLFELLDIFQPVLPDKYKLLTSYVTGKNLL